MNTVARASSTVNGRLVSLRRERTDYETQLVRHEMTPNEQAQFLATLSENLGQLRAQFESKHFSVASQVPPDADVASRVCKWLESHPDITVASRPNV